MTRLSFRTFPSAVSRIGNAVVPRVFASSQSGRGRVTSTTVKPTSCRRPFSDRRISRRWQNGQTGM